MNEPTIILIRLIIPLSILRFPLLGILFSIVIDYFDMGLVNLLGNSNSLNYQNFDKILDVYYLSLAVFITHSWKNRIAKYTAVLLFGYRLLGVLLFLVSQISLFLVIFPNLFEAFYLFYLGGRRLFKKDLITSVKALIVILLLLLIPKITHEYFLHVNTTHPWTENKYFQYFTKPLKLQQNNN